HTAAAAAGGGLFAVTPVLTEGMTVSPARAPFRPSTAPRAAPPTNKTPPPPFWIAAGSLSSIRRAAAHGYNLLLDQFAGFDVIRERIALFKAEHAAHGGAYNPMGIALARDMHVADNQAAKNAA